MRTISVTDNKLVISANDNTTYESVLHNAASAVLDNITINGDVIKTTIDSNDGVVITTIDGKISKIKVYNNGIMDLGLYNITRRVDLLVDDPSAVVFDQSFIDWYDSVKDSKEEIVQIISVEDSMLVVRSGMDVFTHLISNVTFGHQLKIFSPFRKNSIHLFTVSPSINDLEMINVNDELQSRQYYVSPTSRNKNRNILTQSFIDWYKVVKALPSIEHDSIGK